eukprot:1159352-Pelagomonas_calceolata.AAC.1
MDYSKFVVEVFEANTELQVHTCPARRSQLDSKPGNLRGSQNSPHPPFQPHLVGRSRGEGNWRLICSSDLKTLSEGQLPRETTGIVWKAVVQRATCSPEGCSAGDACFKVGLGQPLGTQSPHPRLVV